MIRRMNNTTINAKEFLIPSPCITPPALAYLNVLCSRSKIILFGLLGC
jgi:hypothetical protein